MKKTFFLLFFSLFAAAAFAQTDSLRHEIGADFLPLIRPYDPGSQQASFLYRRHFSNGAFRLRLQGGYYQAHQDNGNQEFRRQGFGILRAGREWQVSFRRTRFYYGLDGRMSYSYSHGSVQLPEWTEHTSRYVEAGILPLLGFSYQVNRRFGISAETNGAITGGRFWQQYRGFISNPGTSRTSSINFRLLSEFSLFLTYRF